MRFNLHCAKTRLEGEQWESHNTKHGREARRRREAVTKEHARNPFSVFHNYISVCSLKTHARLSCQSSKTVAQSPHGHLHARCIIMINIIQSSTHLSTALFPHIEGFSLLLLCSAQDQMTCLCYHHTQPERPKWNSDVPFFCRASRTLEERESRCRIITIHESDLKLFFNSCTYKRQQSVSARWWVVVLHEKCLSPAGSKEWYTSLFLAFVVLVLFCFFFGWLFFVFILFFLQHVNDANPPAAFLLPWLNTDRGSAPNVITVDLEFTMLTPRCSQASRFANQWDWVVNW